MNSDRLTGNELKYLKDVLETDFRASSGAKFMRLFEQEFAKKYGVSHAIACVNGTATMHACLEAWGVGAGDEVIVPPMTMASTTFAVLHCNATPIYADIDPETFQICPKSILSKVNSKTKAIITVALFGMCPEMDEIMDIADRHNLKVLEDNAECFLGEYKGRLVGTVGHAASFSLQNSKHLTSGEGGIIITNDADDADAIRRIVSLGYAGVSAKSGKVTKEEIQHPDYLRHKTLGWNYRMPELCCAVALAQVEKIDNLVSARVEAGKLFEEVVQDYKKWFTPLVTPDYCKNSYWAFACVLKREDISWEIFREKFRELGGDGVYACWKLTYQEPFITNGNFAGRERYISDENFQTYQKGLCPIAEKLQPNLFLFKTNYWLREQAVKQAQILKKTLEFFG